ncbi:hypothetical protein D3C81_1882290 [compost metagenome]
MANRLSVANKKRMKGSAGLETDEGVVQAVCKMNFGAVRNRMSKRGNEDKFVVLVWDEF